MKEVQHLARTDNSQSNYVLENSMNRTSTPASRDEQAQRYVQPVLAFIDADITSGKDEIAREELLTRHARNVGEPLQRF